MLSAPGRPASRPLLALQKPLARCGDGFVVIAARTRGRRLGPKRLARTTVERLGLWLRAFAHAEEPREVDLLDAE